MKNKYHVSAYNNHHKRRLPQNIVMHKRNAKTYIYLILCRLDINTFEKTPLSPALAQWRQKDFIRTS